MLRDLEDAGEIDSISVVNKFTDPEFIKLINSYLSEHPRLSENDYILIKSFLGRDLEERQFFPVREIRRAIELNMPKTEVKKIKK